MGAGHAHTHHVHGTKLFITILLNLLITFAQLIGGLLSGSLALLSDALHNFSDVLALVIAWWAHKLSHKEHTQSKTFGYKRAEILATLFNASVLVALGVYLIVESIARFANPEEIESWWVIALALLSIVLNTASVLLIKDDAHHNMNIKAAYLHLLTDVMTSVAVLLGGLAMLFYQIFWVDSLITLLIAFYLIKSALSLVGESSAILMQFSPQNIDLEALAAKTLQKPQLSNIHHIHIYRLNDTEIFLQAEIDFSEDITLSEASAIIKELQEEFLEEFGISHTTLQANYFKAKRNSLVESDCS